MPADLAALVTQSARLWKCTLVSGVLTVILGTLLLTTPLTFVVTVVFFGAYLLVSGIAQVVFAFSLHASGGGRVLLFISGAASLVLAVLGFSLLRYIEVDAVVLKIQIALAFILRGGATSASAISDRELPGRGGSSPSASSGLLRASSCWRYRSSRSSLQNALRLKTYIQDAEREDDNGRVELFRKRSPVGRTASAGSRHSTEKCVAELR